MIDSRFQVNVKPPSIEPAAHPGGVDDLAVVRRRRSLRTTCCSISDDAPGGEQGLQRPAVEEADDAALDQDADGAGDEERQRARPRRATQSSQPGAAVRTDLLDDEGRVGAEHHHLAMRHVDDAHHAEGDGEADRRQQQHRAEADAVTTFWTASTSSRRCSIAATPVGGGTARPAGASAGTEGSSAALLGSPRPASIATAATLVGFAPHAALAEHDGGPRLARACLTVGSCSLASAASTIGRLLASREWKTARAASSRR